MSTVPVFIPGIQAVALRVYFAYRYHYNRSLNPSGEGIMSIIDRIRRLAEANLHGLLDKMDTPEIVLQGKIEDMEQALAEAKEALADFAVSRKRLEMEHAQSERAVTEWMQKAESEMKCGKESAARSALIHRIRSQDRSRRLSEMLERSKKTYEELKGILVVLSDQLRSAKLNLSELQSRKRAAAARREVGGKLDKALSMSGRDVDFSALEEEVAQTEMEMDIDHRVRVDMETIDREIEQEKYDSIIDSELEKLKRKLERSR
jgi:phage shock protein A